jgi:hypothetical protein
VKPPPTSQPFADVFFIACFVLGLSALIWLIQSGMFQP